MLYTTLRGTVRHVEALPAPADGRACPEAVIASMRRVAMTGITRERLTPRVFHARYQAAVPVT